MWENRNFPPLRRWRRTCPDISKEKRLPLWGRFSFLLGRAVPGVFEGGGILSPVQAGILAPLFCIGARYLWICSTKGETGFAEPAALLRKNRPQRGLYLPIPGRGTEGRSWHRLFRAGPNREFGFPIPICRGGASHRNFPALLGGRGVLFSLKAARKKPPRRKLGRFGMGKCVSLVRVRTGWEKLPVYTRNIKSP